MAYFSQAVPFLPERNRQDRDAQPVCKRCRSKHIVIPEESISCCPLDDIRFFRRFYTKKINILVTNIILGKHDLELHVDPELFFFEKTFPLQVFERLTFPIVCTLVEKKDVYDLYERLMVHSGIKINSFANLICLSIILDHLKLFLAYPKTVQTQLLGLRNKTVLENLKRDSTKSKGTHFLEFFLTIMNRCWVHNKELNLTIGMFDWASILEYKKFSEKPYMKIKGKRLQVPFPFRDDSNMEYIHPYRRIVPTDVIDRGALVRSEKRLRWIDAHWVSHPVPDYIYKSIVVDSGISAGVSSVENTTESDESVNPSTLLTQAQTNQLLSVMHTAQSERIANGEDEECYSSFVRAREEPREHNDNSVPTFEFTTASIPASAEQPAFNPTFAYMNSVQPIEEGESIMQNEVGGTYLVEAFQNFQNQLVAAQSGNSAEDEEPVADPTVFIPYPLPSIMRKNQQPYDDNSTEKEKKEDYLEFIEKNYGPDARSVVFKQLYPGGLPESTIPPETHHDLVEPEAECEDESEKERSGSSLANPSESSETIDDQAETDITKKSDETVNNASDEEREPTAEEEADAWYQEYLNNRDDRWKRKPLTEEEKRAETKKLALVKEFTLEAQKMKRVLRATFASQNGPMKFKPLPKPTVNPPRPTEEQADDKEDNTVGEWTQSDEEFEAAVLRRHHDPQEVYPFHFFDRPKASEPTTGHSHLRHNVPKVEPSQFYFPERPPTRPENDFFYPQLPSYSLFYRNSFELRYPELGRFLAENGRALLKEATEAPPVSSYFIDRLRKRETVNNGNNQDKEQDLVDSMAKVKIGDTERAEMNTCYVPKVAPPKKPINYAEMARDESFWTMSAAPPAKQGSSRYSPTKFSKLMSDIDASLQCSEPTSKKSTAPKSNRDIVKAIAKKRHMLHNNTAAAARLASMIQTDRPQVETAGRKGARFLLGPKLLENSIYKTNYQKEEKNESSFSFAQNERMTTDTSKQNSSIAQSPFRFGTSTALSQMDNRSSSDKFVTVKPEPYSFSSSKKEAAAVEPSNAKMNENSPFSLGSSATLQNPPISNVNMPPVYKPLNPFCMFEPRAPQQSLGNQNPLYVETSANNEQPSAYDKWAALQQSAAAGRISSNTEQTSQVAASFGLLAPTSNTLNLNSRDQMFYLTDSHPAFSNGANSATHAVQNNVSSELFSDPSSIVQPCPSYDAEREYVRSNVARLRAERAAKESLHLSKDTENVHPSQAETESQEQFLFRQFASQQQAAEIASYLRTEGASPYSIPPHLLGKQSHMQTKAVVPSSQPVSEPSVQNNRSTDLVPAKKQKQPHSNCVRSSASLEFKKALLTLSEKDFIDLTNRKTISCEHVIVAIEDAIYELRKMIMSPTQENEPYEQWKRHREDFIARFKFNALFLINQVERNM